MSSAAFPPAGVLSHRPEDIARLIEALRDQAQTITALLGDDAGPFHSRLLFVDPQRHYIIIAAPPAGQAGVLLARSRLDFLAEFNGMHIEFPADDPQFTTLAGQAAIRLQFPTTIMRAQQRRLEPRIAVPGHAALHCEADGDGVAPFDGELVDISRSGIGFLVYGAAIMLEPGTVLRGSRIDRGGTVPVVVDLEVRYTRPVLQPDGRHANRSGCVFLNPTREIAELIDAFNAGTGAEPDAET